MFTHDMKNRVYIGPDISKQPTLTCVQTEIRLSLLGGTAEMSAVSFFVYEPVTWLLTNRCLKIFFCRFIVHILPILIKQTLTRYLLGTELIQRDKTRIADVSLMR